MMKMTLSSSLSLQMNAHIKMKSTGPCWHFFKAHQQVWERQGGKKESSAYCASHHQFLTYSDLYDLLESTGCPSLQD